MLKKTMLLVAAVAALTALVVPAMANADARNWEHNEDPLVGNVPIETHGTAKFTSSQGGLECPTVAKATLEAGSTGKITAFDPKTTAGCKYSGTLASLCSGLALHQPTNFPWIIHATKFSGGQYGMVVTGVDIHVDGTGAFCPNVTITGPAFLTGDPHEGKTLTIENGTVVHEKEPPEEDVVTSLHSPNLGVPITASGTQEITPANTYEIET